MRVQQGLPLPHDLGSLPGLSVLVIQWVQPAGASENQGGHLEDSVLELSLSQWTGELALCTPEGSDCPEHTTCGNHGMGADPPTSLQEHTPGPGSTTLWDPLTPTSPSPPWSPLQLTLIPTSSEHIRGARTLPKGKGKAVQNGPQSHLPLSSCGGGDGVQVVVGSDARSELNLTCFFLHALMQTLATLNLTRPVGRLCPGTNSIFVEVWGGRSGV